MNTKHRTIGIAAAVGLAGALAGGILAGTLSASAESAGSTTAVGYGGPPGAGGYGAPGGTRAGGDPSQPQRSDEKLLTGTTKAKVTAAVRAKYPDATIQRVETDSDGVYEAHVLQDGRPVIVQVGKDFTVTGTQTMGQGGPGGPGGHAPGGQEGGPPTALGAEG